jgi:membrane AbrB-like protein
LRVFIIVLLIPLAVGSFMPLSEARAQLDAAAAMSADLAEWLVLILGVGAGIVVAHLIRLPAPQMTGAMFASAALHLTGASTVLLPDLLLQLALWIVGSSIGAQFAGFDLRTLFAIGRHAAMVAVMMIALAAVVAVGLGALLDLDTLATLLAFVPGGIAEMCLIAVVLDVDPAFVALHHLLRLSLILLLAPVVGAMAKRHALAKLALPDR